MKNWITPVLIIGGLVLVGVFVWWYTERIKAKQSQAEYQKERQDAIPTESMEPKGATKWVEVDGKMVEVPIHTAKLQ